MQGCIVTKAWPPSAKGRGMGPAGYKSSAKQMTCETVGGYGVERSETKPFVTIYPCIVKRYRKQNWLARDWGQPDGCHVLGLLILVEGTSGGHVVDLVADIFQDGLIFILPFFADPVDDISILGDSSQDHVDQLDDVDHVLLDETA